MKAHGFWTVRRQLALLFGIMLVAAVTVLALDTIYQHNHEATLNDLYDNALGGQRNVEALIDAYGINIGATTFKVRNGLLNFADGTLAVDAARQQIDQAFAALAAEHMPPRQQAVFASIQHERAAADVAIATLRAQLAAHSVQGVGRFADTQLFPALQPLISDLKLLADLKILDAQARLQDDRAHAARLNLWRIGLSLLALVIVLVAGRRVLRNIYSGIGQLVRLSQSMRTGDYDAPVGSRVKGEVGEVMDGFLVMREEVKHKDAALRESENRARAASKAKSAFLAAMSHEIRTPMIGITGMLELLEHTPLNAEQRRSVAIVQSSAQSLLQIIGDILDFSKIEAGRMELAPVDIDLRHLVERTVGNYLGVASSKGLTLEASIDDNLAPAYIADPLRIRQILSNFLSNAVKFTRTGGVTVRAERVEALADGRDRIALRVRDSGIGISVAQRSLLFQPFAQADSSTTRRFGGTGLGLAICLQLAELMGGHIDLVSEPGVGSTFSLLLPLAAGDPAKVEPEREITGDEDFPTRALPGIEQAERERSLVLVVDDHPTNREVLTRQLARAGFACETAVDGEEGLQRWATGAYALVLTDIHMPKMDGYQLTAAIRQAERKQQRSRTPIIAITANVSKGEPEHCLALGMDGFLGKPLRIAQLSLTLRRWLPHVAFPASNHPPAADSAEEFEVADDALFTPAAPIDATVLKEIAGDDQTLAHNLLNDFLAAARKDLAKLKTALAHADWPEAIRQSHRMKGAAALVGAVDMQQAAATAEAAGRRDDINGMKDATQRLSRALDLLAVWVER
jgi:signal transduction histidine kinase/CheY-like chemotaxis protein